MRAAFYDRNGPAREVIAIGEVPDPVPGPGEVRVRIAASGLNPSDVKRRSGFGGQRTTSLSIPNSDGSGTIEAVGEGVDPARVGERVWIYFAQWGRPFGTNAELCVVPAHLAVPMPDALGFVEAACLGIPALTAHVALFTDGPLSGKTVMVTGGAGAVGHYAIQLAKWAGAKVITTVSFSDKAERAKAAGADLAIDYKREDVAAAVADFTQGRGVDRLVEVDFGGNLATTMKLFPPPGETEVRGGADLRRARKVIADNAVIATYASHGEERPVLPFYPMMMRGLTLRFVFLYIVPQPLLDAAIKDLTILTAEGRLSHAIGARFPLVRTAEAHEAQESGKTLGNIVIEME